MPLSRDASVKRYLIIIITFPLCWLRLGASLFLEMAAAASYTDSEMGWLLETGKPMFVSSDSCPPGLAS
jgi:hypothetical protein